MICILYSFNIYNCVCDVYIYKFILAPYIFLKKKDFFFICFYSIIFLQEVQQHSDG